MLDVIVNCFSAFYDEDGKLIKNNRKIFFVYLKGWMFIDVLASFPFNLIEIYLLEEESTSAGSNYN